MVKKAGASGWPLRMMVIGTVLAAYASYRLRSSCFGDSLASLSLSGATGCDSDLAVMWYSRGLAEHVMPYLQLLPTWGGKPATVEYPVLSGLLMWLLSLPASSYAEFIAIVAVVMGGLAVWLTVIVYRAAGARTWVWVASPALVFYLTYNLDLPPVLCMVGAFALVTGQDPRTIRRRRYLGAALLLGLGGALKLFPLLFGPALMAWLLFGRPGSGQTPLRVRARRSGEAAASAIALLVAVNLPIYLANPKGWLAPLAYQASRAITQDTMSIWYIVNTWAGMSQGRLMAMATLATAVGLVSVLAIGWRLARGVGEYPLLGISLGLLAAYLLLNKVFSQQYTIWVLPLLVFIGFRLWATVAVVAVDVALYWSWHLLVLASVTGRMRSYQLWRVVNEASIGARGWLLLGLATIAVAAPLLGRQRLRRFLAQGSPLLAASASRPGHPRLVPAHQLSEEPAVDRVPVLAGRASD
jgi:Predicted integral membrane protein